VFEPEFNCAEVSSGSVTCARQATSKTKSEGDGGRRCDACYRGFESGDAQILTTSKGRDDDMRARGHDGLPLVGIKGHGES